ncbi:Mannose-6-phosphate isomerase, class I [Bacteroides clarus YIT 12056]|uniref:Mannose-6-phosphate isomerase, class I n=1 Tax=Bacteroides clarus YIT 12056 TaxID=762984 RepID=A0ABP2KQG4_9BACE|nr:class I mannose-6-phosphate isomerase [Bacteroides clarus]EGF51390.1 putative mannose-6-phosphate isomerase, class I [Bacteroides clarus YIT 12056]SHG93241.1 Mannose-6-phosphate isomerase, class I [Bacteroides clarus YIT 12056]
MNKYLLNNKKSNYDKFPVVQVPGEEHSCVTGWENVTAELRSLLQQKKILVVECYQGVHDDEVLKALYEGFPEACILESVAAMKGQDALYNTIKDDVTDDEIFGYMTRYTMEVYFDNAKVEHMRKLITSSSAEYIIIYGVGASYIWQEPAILAYLDMARWEIQLRFRRNEVTNIGFKNQAERASLQYKQAFFVDWRICDRWKKQIMKQIDVFIDTNKTGEPKMASAAAIFKGLDIAASRPFRVVPYFDQGPWGGQWMKEICDLDKEAINYAWCFDCVLEENSLLLGFGDVCFEIPSIDLVFTHPVQLLGPNVYGRFGDEFPIRFDFLDTMEGGNLSLQVHPLVEYIQEKFGMHYTQEESYYILDAKEDAKVYLGLKEGVNPEVMVDELCQAQKSGVFDVEKYVGVYEVKKHDHVLIPPGTIHCSGSNSMVLEISATPYIFTFKLWDWGRLGLDGRPRPINIEHGKHVIQWDRTESWVKKEAINCFVTIAEDEGWLEEHTGLHEREFIETRRHWFTGKVLHKTNGSVQVLNLVEGREVIVESPAGAFTPFVVHYAETFIIPAAVDTYTIRPYGESEGKECATIKAYIRK